MTIPSSARPHISELSVRGAWLFGGVVVLPAVLFVVLQPDWYYLQNGLDPFFYTGYVQNFQNLFHAVGDRHYFISRWTIYLPQRLLLMLVDDPKLAFLLFRWIGAGVVAGAVLRLGRDRWRRADSIAMAAIVLMMPISIRALLTDYSDAVMFPLGAALLALLALHPDRLRSAAVAGALGAAIVVANPFGATVAIAAAPFWLRRVPRRRWLVLLGAAAGGAVVVVIGGLLFFRWRYGVPNVYAPTIDFVRTRRAEQDPLKSPRLWWLGYRLWIYLPALLIAVYHAMRRWCHFEFDAVERAVVSTCALQYAIQIWVQFARHGDTLEISYYWSYIVPSFALTFCVVAGALAQRCGRRHLPAISVALAVAIRVIGSPTPELFQSWLDAVIVLGGGAYLARRMVVSRPALVSTGLIGALVLLQTSSPRPEPILPGELRVLSSYELVYEGQSSVGVQSFETVTWFVKAMNDVPEPVTRSAVFWYNTAIGARMSAMFGVQVSGRWLNPSWESNVATDPFPPDVVIAIQAGNAPTIVVIGSAADARAIADQIVQVEPKMRLVYEATAPDEPDTVVEVLSTVEF